MDHAVNSALHLRGLAWVPLLACPAVFRAHALLGKPAVAPYSQAMRQPAISVLECDFVPEI